jgi:hypothetical protein
MNTTPPTAEELATLMQSADTLRSVAEQASRAGELEKENERLGKIVGRQCALLNDAYDAMGIHSLTNLAGQITRMREDLKTAQAGNRNYAANVERLKQERNEFQAALIHVKAERDNWEDTTNMHLRNEQYYRSLLDETAKHLGQEAYVRDDGSRSDAPLAAKVPELVGKLAIEAVNLRTQNLLLTTHNEVLVAHNIYLKAALRTNQPEIES